MIKSFYFPVSSKEDGIALEKFLSRLCGLHFVSEDPVAGDLDDVLKILSESNAFRLIRAKKI